MGTYSSIETYPSMGTVFQEIVSILSTGTYLSVGTHPSMDTDLSVGTIFRKVAVSRWIRTHLVSMQLAL